MGFLLHVRGVSSLSGRVFFNKQIMRRFGAFTCYHRHLFCTLVSIFFFSFFLFHSLCSLTQRVEGKATMVKREGGKKCAANKRSRRMERRVNEEK